MANPYPANFEDADGTVRFSGQVDFTDSGNQPGGSQPLLTFPIAFGDAGLAAGKVIWTPSVDMWLRELWLYLTTGWDGTSPLCDVGVVADGGGLFAAVNAGNTAVDVSIGHEWAGLGVAPSFVASDGGGTQILSWVGDPYQGNAVPPLFVAAGKPVAVWVTQDGSPGGADPGASQGTLAVVIDAEAA